MSIVLHVKKFCVTLLASSIVVGLPLFWFRFCQTSPDSVVVEMLCPEGTSVSLLSHGLEGLSTPLDDFWTGEVTVPNMTGGKNDLGRHLFRYVSMGRLQPQSCIFHFEFEGTDSVERLVVRRIRFRKHGFFSAFVSGRDLENRYKIHGASVQQTEFGTELLLSNGNVLFAPSDDYSIHWTFKPEFRGWTSHDKLSLALILFLVFGCSVIALFPNFNPTVSYFSRDLLIPTTLVSICFALFFTIVLPLSSYLANRNGFDFSTETLFFQQLPRFSATFAVCLAACLSAYSILGWTPILLLQGFLIYEYLETGIFSADFPSLAGSVDFFHATWRQVADFVVLAFCLCAFVFAGKWIRPRLHWFSLGLMIMILASLADTRVVDSSSSTSKRDPRIMPGRTVLEKAEFSGQKNIIFFVLDAIDVKVADDVLKANPDWNEVLTGFIAFTNNVGMYSHTSYGVPGILTGQYSSSRRMSSTYGSTAIGTNSFLLSYANAGHPVYSLQSGLGCGWSTETNSTSVNTSQASSTEMRHGDRVDAFHQRMEAQMAWNLDELCSFRAMPFFEKAKCLTRFRTLWDHGMALTPPESVLFAALRKAPVKTDIPCTLHFYHSKGGHIPFVRDRDGNAWKGPDNLNGYFEQSWYALSETVAFLQNLKNKGIYDNSLIVLLADHGLTYEHFKDVERNTHPFLWVKPPHQTESLRLSGEPTSHSKVHLLAIESLTRDLSHDDVIRILSQRNGRVAWTLERRVFYDPHYYNATGVPTSSRK